jgi:hypothetical protein
LIASFRHNFIFLKTRKVGGTSLEIVLSTWCGDQDICSPVTPEDEELRRDAGGMARNFLGADGKPRFYNHMPASEVKTALPELWSKAFKFTVDRHPYEKVVSRAWWNIGRRNGDPEKELDAEIEKAIESRSYLNYPIYMIGGDLAVDELWPYETMWQRLRGFADRLGIPAPTRQPKAKAGHRQDRTPAAQTLTPEQREQIYRDARVEFDLLGYEP